MHARQLVELAAVVSAHGAVLVEAHAPLSASSVEQYWIASKCRLDRWARSLKQFRAQQNIADDSDNDLDDDADLEDDARGAAAQFDASQINRGRRQRSPRAPSWATIRPVLEEILTGEVLSRVWAAVMTAYDHRRATNLAEPIARGILLGHMEARNRVLTLVVEGRGIHPRQAFALNQLRRRTERWVDLLIGYLVAMHDVSQFAAHPDRARQFADDLRHERGMRGGRQAWPLTLAAIRAAFSQCANGSSPNADLNGDIASSILACFQPDVFDSTGGMASLWLVRLTNTTADAQGMIDDLLREENGQPSLESRKPFRRLEE